MGAEWAGRGDKQAGQRDSLVYPDNREVGICCHPLEAADMTSAVAEVWWVFLATVWLFAPVVSQIH